MDPARVDRLIRLCPLTSVICAHGGRKIAITGSGPDGALPRQSRLLVLAHRPPELLRSLAGRLVGCGCGADQAHALRSWFRLRRMRPEERFAAGGWHPLAFRHA